jgi:hypothetical protein
MPLQLGPDLEPEMERLLTRLVPDFTSQVEGATPDEIEAIERLAGRPLPQYYGWFLWRMGRNMGPLAYRSLDFSAQRVLASYENGTFKPDPRFLMIGYETDPIHPLHIAYDLDYPARDDARVTRFDGEPFLHDQSFETLREMHAYGLLLRLKYPTQAQRLGAVLYDDQDSNVAALLVPVMAKLGFTSPIETGPYCTLYEREDAMVVGCTRLTQDVPGSQPISLGARSQAEIRSILGTITTETGLEVDIDEWDPPLP